MCKQGHWRLCVNSYIVILDARLLMIIFQLKKEKKKDVGSGGRPEKRPAAGSLGMMRPNGLCSCDDVERWWALSVDDASTTSRPPEYCSGYTTVWTI